MRLRLVNEEEPRDVALESAPECRGQPVEQIERGLQVDPRTRTGAPSAQHRNPPRPRMAGQRHTGQCRHDAVEPGRHAEREPAADAEAALDSSQRNGEITGHGCSPGEAAHQFILP